MTLTMLDNPLKAESLARTLNQGRRRPVIILTPSNKDDTYAIPLTEASTLFGPLPVDAYAIRGRLTLDYLNHGLRMPVYNGAVGAWRGPYSFLWLKDKVDPRRILAWCRINPDMKPATPAIAPATRIRLRETEKENQRLRDQLQRLRNTITLPDTSTWFTQPADHWDFDIRYRWAQRTPAGEKTTRPLPETWTYDKDFHIPQDVYATAIDTMCDALDGTDHTRLSRRLHALRISDEPGAPTRASRYGTPVFRSRMGGGHNPWMLHYTTDRAGGIVFLDIERHDSLRPA